MRSSRWLVVSALTAASFTASLQATQQVGVVRGLVTDGDGNALPGCDVRIGSSSSGGRTDSTGWFTLVSVPAGAQRIQASCLGFEDRAVDVEIAERETTRVDLQLAAHLYQEEVTVRAFPILEGQAKALNQQKTAINIKSIVAADLMGSFPDPNAAEAAQRIPGVTLQRDQGEGRYVIVRGTEPRLTGAMINGERIPSPEGDTRYVALDVVPADLLESIEVTKAITPDMDADSIGGSVNLVTKQVPLSQHVNATAGVGYNDISDDDILQGNLTWGSQLGADDRIGLLLGASYLETDRGSENFEVGYDDGDLDSLEFRDYSVRREREGYTLDLDTRPSDRDNFRVRGIYNEFGDQEFRRRKTEAPGDDAIERELKDRFEIQEIASYSLQGERILSGAGAILDYTASYHRAKESEPHSVYSIFVQEDVEFDPNVSPGAIDPDNIQANPLNENISEYTLDHLELVDALTEDEDVVAGANLMLPLARGDRGFWKLGAKYRAKDKFRDNRLDQVEADDDLFLEDFIDPSFDGGSIIDGRYDMGPFQGRSQVDRILGRDDLETEQDLEEELADYDAEENTLAAYAMAQVDVGSQLRFLGGARFESTDARYGANELVFDEEGDPESLTPVEGDNDQSEVLPMAHLVWDLGNESNLRAAATRTLSRPNFSDLAPFQLIVREDQEIERGNPDLDLGTAINLDLLYEKYFTSVGVLSAGVFYKDLADNIFLSRSEEVRDGQIFDVTQPINGDGAELLGAELAYQNRFASLPEPFDGLGIYFNVTLTDSSAQLAGRPDFDLVGQSDSSGNLALSYEKAGFSGRLSLNHHDDYILEVGGEPASDLFVDDHQQLDFSASQRITSKLRIFLELINLTDEPYRVYEGSVDRPTQEEYYSWWGTIGVKVNL